MELERHAGKWIMIFFYFGVEYPFNSKCICLKEESNIFLGWPEGEQIMGQFSSLGELSLSKMNMLLALGIEPMTIVSAVWATYLFILYLLLFETKKCVFGPWVYIILN